VRINLIASTVLHRGGAARHARVVLVFAAIAAPHAEPLAAQSSTTLPNSTCEWKLSEPQAITNIVGSDSLWFGRIGGFAAAESSQVLFVSDVLQHQVLRIDLSAKRFSRIGRDGEGPGEFRVPTVIAVASDTSFWVYDGVLHRLSHFDSDGEYLIGFRLPFPIIGALSLEIDRVGDLYLSGYAVGSPFYGYLIHKFTPEGEHLISFAEGAPLDEAGDPRHRGGPLLAAASGSTLWFSPAGATLGLQQYDLSGRLLRSIEFDSPQDLDMITQRLESRGGEMRLVAQRRMGSISLVRMAAGTLLNVANIDRAGTVQFDIIDESSGTARATWRDKGPLIAGGDGVKYVFSVDVTGPEIWRHEALCTDAHS